VHVRLSKAAVQRRAANVSLHRSDGGPECARREETWAEWACGVLSHSRQQLKRRPDFRTHVRELPGDLVGDGGELSGCGESDSLCRVGGCAQGMRTHVGDACRVGGRTSRGHRSRRRHGACSSTGDETLANLAGGIKVAPGKCPGPSNGIAWTTIGRRFHFEKAKDALSAIRRPRC